MLILKRCTNCNVILANQDNTECDSCFQSELYKRKGWDSTVKLLDLIINFLKDGIVWDGSEDEQHLPEFLIRMKAKGVIKHEQD